MFQKLLPGERQSRTLAGFYVSPLGFCDQHAVRNHFQQIAPFSLRSSVNSADTSPSTNESKSGLLLETVYPRGFAQKVTALTVAASPPDVDEA